jgi:hypothetical protein
VLNQINSFHIAASFTVIQSNIVLPYVCTFLQMVSILQVFFSTRMLHAFRTSALGILYQSNLNSYILSVEHNYKT